MKYCQACGRRENNDNAAYCLNCGAKFSVGNTASAASQPVIVSPAPRAKKGVPVTGFVFSLVGVLSVVAAMVLSNMPYVTASEGMKYILLAAAFLSAVVLGTMGLIFCCTSYKNTSGTVRGLCTVGMILGFISIVISLLPVIFCVKDGHLQQLTAFIL